MASLTWSPSIIRSHAFLRSQLHDPGPWRVQRPLKRATFPITRLKNQCVLCARELPWEGSSSYSPTTTDGISIINRGNLVEPIDTEDSPEPSFLDNEQGIIDMKNKPPLQFKLPLKWTMWLLGPCIFLGTGMVPTLWLPLSSVFLGPHTSGLLSLVGLDCIYNMGATLFLLMADACARPKGNSNAQRSQVPLTYKLWNLGASLLGFLVPLVLLFASNKGFLQPHLPLMSFAVLLGPYLLLLATQMLAEVLSWHWKSPAWLVAPVVYEAYRVLQLMRGLSLGSEVGAPAWAVETIRWLVCWWVLVLGIQLMRVAWFAGLSSRTQQQSS